MSRLTKRAENGAAVYATPSGDPVKWENNRNKVLRKLADYEDLEEKGLLLRLPCKVGDTVYQIPSKVNYDLNVLHGYDANNRVYNQKVSKIVLDGEYWYLECDKDREYGTGRICLDRSFGETWFLTKEEAEKALKEMERLNEQRE